MAADVKHKMAPDINKMAANNVVKMAADVRWCQTCLKTGGVKSRVRVMQINMEEAVVLCENPECYSQTTEKVILPRSVAKLASLKQRKKHRQPVTATAISSSSVSGPLSPPIHEHLSQGIPGSTNSGTIPTVPSLRTALWEDKVMQWKNKDALCWLDVSMCALVHSVSLRECLRRQNGPSLLRKLCNEFDRAQTVSCEDEQDLLVGERTDHDRLNGRRISPKTTSSTMQYPASLCPSLANLDADAALEWLVMSDEETKDHLQSDKLSSKPLVNTPTQDAPTILSNIREKVWTSLQPKLDCKLGSEESPVFALPLLARLGGAIEEHFLMRYRWEFYCTVCHHTEIKMCKKSMISLTHLPADFNLSAPSILRTCPACNSPGQTSRMTYHSMPACMMFHFAAGVHDPNMTSHRIQPSATDIKSNYEVSCVIQYINNPNHFVVWCRDVQRNLWLKCNDLDDPVCKWQTQPPVIPASEIHIVMLERQGDPCTSCAAMNLDMKRIRCNVDQTVEQRLVKGKPSVRNGVNLLSAVATQNCSPAVVSNGTISRNGVQNGRYSPVPFTNGPYVPTVTQNGQSSNGLNSSIVHPNGANPLNHNSTVNAHRHMARKRFSGFQSGQSNSSNLDQSVFDLDTELNDGHETHSLANGLGNDTSSRRTSVKDDTWSRSSSPLTVSTVGSSKRSRRSLPKYLQGDKAHRGGANKKMSSSPAPPVDMDEASSIVTSVSFNSSQVSTGTKFSANNVYAKRRRPNRRVASGGTPLYFPRKTLYPGYKVSGGNEAGAEDDSRSATPTPVRNLAVSLPAGAFRQWASRNGYSNGVCDRSTNSSPSDFVLTNNANHQVSDTTDATTRPRCNSLSSVSSPSACSDLSSLSDNTSLNGSGSSGKDDLTSTIDELYKALQLHADSSSTNTATAGNTPFGSRIPSPMLDDSFLAEILADDPVPAALPSRGGDAVILTQSKRGEPSIIVGAGQVLDGLVPSIEPMEQGLLEKLVA